MPTLLYGGRPIDLEDPLFIRWINCRTDRERAAFADRYGDVAVANSNLSPGLSRDQIEAVVAGHLLMMTERMLPIDPDERSAGYYLAGPDGPIPLRDPKDLEPDIAFLLSGITLKPRIVRQGRMVFDVPDIFSFMCLELAAAREAGALSKRCEHCEKLFLFGPSTGRRSSAKFCADRCRVAAARAARGGQGVDER